MLGVATVVECRGIKGTPPPPFIAMARELANTLLNYLTLGWIAPKVLAEDGAGKQFDLLATVA